MAKPERPYPPILQDKACDAPTVFTPENLLREARRQKNVGNGLVPSVCALDPDGDLVRRLTNEGRARRDPYWACYHTDLFRFEQDGLEIGLIGCAVGAPFAVLLAEQLFASGCRFLVTVTSAGQISPLGPPPYFVLIDRALRDEGTSYHYLPAADWSVASESLLSVMEGAFDSMAVRVVPGASWTTDAPYRETQAAIDSARARGILCVEMEAAALYAFARARDKPVLCFAHVTNQMGRIDGDFEKGEADGTVDSLAVIAAAARRFLSSEAKE